MTVTNLHAADGALDPDYGRTPPQDIAAEQSVLGACLMSGAAFDEALDLGLRGVDFYRSAHEMVWNAIHTLRARNQPADAVTVPAELHGRGELSRVGGPAYVHTLLETVPTAANVAFYAKIVRERAILRRLVNAGTKIVQLGYAADGGNTDEIVNAASAEVAAVADTVHVSNDESLDDVADRALAMMESGEVVTPTPWVALNDIIGGARPGRFIAVGARPAVGKTVFALQWAIAHARHHRSSGHQVVYGTWEMTSERLYQRGLASVSGVPVRNIQRGQLSDRQWKDVLDADIDLRGLPLQFVGASGWSAQQFRAKTRQLHRSRPVGLFIVDHIGLTRPERSGGKENRQAELSEAADVVLGTAHELSATALVLTQLNRGPSTRQDQRPVPTDVRDTDRIEQNADVLMLLHRDKDKQPTDLWTAVAKNREGDEQSIKLTFDGGRSRITDPEWKAHGGHK